MRGVRKLIERIGTLKIRTKFILSYSILLILPLCLIGLRYYNTSLEIVTELARKNTYDILTTNNQIINNMFGEVEKNTLSIIRDRDLFNTLNGIDKNKSLNVYNVDRQVSKIIDKYFSQNPDIYSAQIATSYCIFGNNTSLITPSNLGDSYVYTRAMSADGKLQWIPTYDFTEMFKNNELRDYYNERYIFSAARVMNSFYLDNSTISTLNNNVERPVLIVNFQESFLRNQFEKNLPIKSAEFFIISKEGSIITHNEVKRVGVVEKPSWLDEIVKNGSGTSYLNYNGQRTILCYDTLISTGWMSVVLVPVNSLMGNFGPIVKSSTIYITLIFVCLSMILALLISGRISKPINQLLKVMKKMSEGDFDTRVPVEIQDEFGYFTNKFNQMNEKIKRLIEENFVVKIREKETQIMALNLQMNPHFLYNALNIINCMAIENEGREVSQMIIKLRDMLIYTVKDKKDVVLLSDDLQWLENYLYIMSKRYEDKFTVCFDIDKRLYDTAVPKLFLQPFVENAIIHGFEELDEEGVIFISGNIIKDKRIFSVSDNGKGMDKDTAAKILTEENSSIGVSNVDRRVKLLYGQEYGVTIKSECGKGTEICVILPLDEDKNKKIS